MTAPSLKCPLPPGAHVGGAEIRMRPVTCPACWATLHARDFECTEAGYRLVCQCGLEIVSIEV
jgi:hypothetical protein